MKDEEMLNGVIQTYQIEIHVVQLQVLQSSVQCLWYIFRQVIIAPASL